MPYGAAGGKGEIEQPCDNLYVEGLPPNIDDTTLNYIFSQYGVVQQCKVLAAKPGMPAVALVRFGSVAEAAQVKDLLHGNIPEGCEGPIMIKYKGAGPGGGAQAAVPLGAFGKGLPGKGGPVQVGLMAKAIVKGFEDCGALPDGSGVGISDAGTLYVAGLPRDMEEIDLYKIFSPS